MRVFEVNAIYSSGFTSLRFVEASTEGEAHAIVMASSSQIVATMPNRSMLEMMLDRRMVFTALLNPNLRRIA